MDNGQFKIMMAEFKGFVQAKFEEHEKLNKVQLEVLTEKERANHECLCQLRDSVTDIQRQLAVTAALRKMKDAAWGAAGGAAMMILVALVKDFLKIKILGGN